MGVTMEKPANESCGQCKHYFSAPKIGSFVPMFPYSMACGLLKEQQDWVETRPQFWCQRFERKATS